MVSTLERMRQQREEASKGGFVPFFFQMKDRQRALIRPLLPLDSALTVYFHRFFDKANNRYGEAVCGREIGQKCIYCHDAELTKEDKKKKELTPKEMFMVPVWLYAIQHKKVENGVEVLDANDNPIWEKLTYTDKESNEEKPVCGIRVMQLAFKGTALSKVAEAFFDLTEAGESIADRDFIISRVGGGTDTSYVPSKRQPAPFKVQLETPVTQEWLKQRVFEVAPPVTLDEPSTPLQGGKKLATGVTEEQEKDETW
jgi:hypothetical protein